MSIQSLYSFFLEHPSVQTDTRKLKSGDIFFALKGDNFNGNAFAANAIEQGAAAVVIDDAAYEIPGKTFLVDDVLAALQELALYHRQQFKIPIIAITGSNGKTTTKELIHAVLASTYRVSTTEGNLNNHIGVPLTILKVNQSHELAVIEMGANHIGEIASYCKWALPTHGLITNCGKAHLEGFGGVEGVRKGKGELFDHLRTHEGIVFRMNDYDYLHAMSAGIHHVITYGTHDADICGTLIADQPFLEAGITGKVDIPSIKTSLVGGYNLPNILAAVCVGHHFGVNPKNTKTAIEAYAPSNSRSQLIKSGTNTIILDAYNANPSSMKLAIENFAKLDAKEKVLVLGAMAELGEESLEEHKAILELISRYSWKAVVLVGGDFMKVPHPYQRFENSTAAKSWLDEQGYENTHWLVKGSRSTRMELVL